ncbi:uncharacterized protein VTP21DRAFT_2452 [Calcarisporiella thermophila]|uniref:uncharacterized protein n=1 Tax=Calcarisporiella thermophila TaxID=911321 RepID=UPI003742065B
MFGKKKKRDIPTDVASDEKEKPSENAFDLIDPKEALILKKQIESETFNASYFGLYRYASTTDQVLMAIGLIASIVPGAALPSLSLLNGKIVDSMIAFMTHRITVEEFKASMNEITLYFVYIAIGVFVCSYIYMAFWLYVGDRITRKVRAKYLTSVLHQNIGWFDKTGIGEVTTRITNDTNQLQDGVSEKLPMVVEGFATFISGWIFGFIANWKVTLVLLCVSPFITLSMGLMNKFIIKYVMRSNDKLSQAGTIAEEAISASRTTVAFGAEDKLSNRYEALIKESCKVGIKKVLSLGFGLGAMMFFVYATYAIAFFYGGQLVFEGDTTPGKLTNVIFAILMSTFSLSHTMPQFRFFSLAVAAGSKLFATIDRTPPINSLSEEGRKPDTVDGCIEFKNVSFRYPSRPEVLVLDNFSLVVQPNTTVALVGESGSGKSTIVQLVERFYDPVRGLVQLDGTDIRELNVKWLRHQIGIVSQEPILFNATIAENIAFGLVGVDWERDSYEKYMDQIIEAAKMANAHDFM